MIEIIAKEIRRMEFDGKIFTLYGIYYAPE
jgi:hypothetical protein